jgi:hypothetical protein
MTKAYVGRCASARCSGGTAGSSYVLTQPERYGIPVEIVKALPNDEEIYHCDWCKFVWQQPKTAKLGVNAASLGYLDGEAGARVFKENRLVLIRDWKLNLRPDPSGPPGRGGGPRRNRR